MSGKYHPGRALPLFEHVCSDTGKRARFHTCVRMAIGSGDLSLVRVDPGRINSNNTKLLRKINEYLDSMQEHYGALHPEACASAVKSAKRVVAEVAQELGVKIEKRVKGETLAKRACKAKASKE